MVLIFILLIISLFFKKIISTYFIFCLIISYMNCCIFDLFSLFFLLYLVTFISMFGDFGWE